MSNAKGLLDKAYWPLTILLIILVLWVFLPIGGVDQPDNVGTFAADPSEYAGTAITDTCVDHDSYDMHYHFDLFVLINGSEMDIPANVGINGDCMKGMHTHDQSGHVHIELGEDYSGNTPTLHDFFSVWGYEFSNSELLGSVGDVSLEINDEVSEVTNPEGYRPADGDVITISLS